PYNPAAVLTATGMSVTGKGDDRGEREELIVHPEARAQTPEGPCPDRPTDAGRLEDKHQTDRETGQRQRVAELGLPGQIGLIGGQEGGNPEPRCEPAPSDETDGAEKRDGGDYHRDDVERLGGSQRISEHGIQHAYEDELEEAVVTDRERRGVRERGVLG